MQSMTGFAHTTISWRNLEISIDIKAVNGRFLDPVVRLPRELMPIEADIRKQIQGRISRGRVEVHINLNTATAGQEVSQAAVENYRRIAEDLRQMGVEGALDVRTLLQLPGVLSSPQIDPESEELTGAVTRGITAALDHLVVARRLEGATIRQDLTQRVERMSTLVAQIRQATGEVKSYYTEKLRQRLTEISTGTVNVDENRLAQELIYYVERSDISEEMSRLETHLDRFAEHLKSDSDDVGKNLDFLCQELNREITTTLSKSPAAGLSHLGVEAKAEIERIREQVQNVQ